MEGKPVGIPFVLFMIHVWACPYPCQPTTPCNVEGLFALTYRAAIPRPFPANNPARGHNGRRQGFVIFPVLSDKQRHKETGGAEPGKGLASVFAKPPVFLGSDAMPARRRQGIPLRVSGELFRNEKPRPRVPWLPQGEALPESPQPVSNLHQDLLGWKLLNPSLHKLASPLLPGLDQVLADFILIRLRQA